MSTIGRQMQLRGSKGGLIGRVLPMQMSNIYSGHRLALWLFGALILVRLAQMVTIFIDPNVIRSADGILIETFNRPAQVAIVSIFRVLGFLNILICLLGLLALLRYRAMVPLMYLVLITLFAGQKVISIVYPIPRAPDAAGGIIVWAMFALTIIGFVLSITNRVSRNG